MAESSKMLKLRAFPPRTTIGPSVAAMAGARHKKIRDLLALTRNFGAEIQSFTEPAMKTAVEARLGELIAFGNRAGGVSRKAFVAFLGEAVAVYNPETEKHQQRVAAACVAITERLSAPLKNLVDVKTLELAGRLHDFGKIGFPRRMQKRKIEADDPLRALIATHLYISLYFTEAVGIFREAAKIIRYNHAYDGYPLNCATEDMLTVPFSSQILSAVDCVDAIINKRAYRAGQALSHREAFQELAQRNYHPEIKRLVCELLLTKLSHLQLLAQKP